MGIKNLHKFIKGHANHVYRVKNLDTYQGKRIAIDTCIYLYKYKSIFKTKWIHSFINLISTLKKLKIHPVFVYDTSAPIEKTNKKQERRNIKNNIETQISNLKKDLEVDDETGVISEALSNVNMKRQGCIYNLLNTETPYNRETAVQEIAFLKRKVTHVTSADYEFTKQVLDALGIPYINAPMEGETLCSHLCYLGKVDAVLSDDTDVLAYGAPYLLTRLDIGKRQVQEICFKELITSLDMDEKMFKDFCIMCGTDYNPNIYNISSKRAYGLISQYKSIEGVRDGNPNIDISILNHHRVRELFSIPDTIDYDFKETPSDINMLRKILKEHSCSLPEHILITLE